MPSQQSRANIVLDLFEQYYHRVYCFSRRSLPADSAEDIAQEVFLDFSSWKGCQS